MAKKDTSYKGGGSGVTFTPDSSYAGPYNYTRADVPIYAPGTGYNQNLPTPPGQPPAAPPPTTPGKKPGLPRTPRIGSGSGIGAGGPAKGNGPPAHNAFTGNGQNAAYLKNGGRPRNIFDFSSSLHDRGELPRMAVNQTGTGMALGGAGRFAARPAAPAQQWQDPGFSSNNIPPVSGAIPPRAPITAGSLPSGSIQNPIYKYPAGTQLPGAPPRPMTPIQGMPVTAPSNPAPRTPGVIGSANPGPAPRLNFNSPQQRSGIVNALAGPMASRVMR